MTGGSVAAVLLVLAWSRIHSVVALYVVWCGLGLVMASVLYEPAFAVLAKWFPDARERRRAMTTMTLAGALASFIFLPLAQALIDQLGWRDALVVLALILGATTVPLHAVILRGAPFDAHDDHRSHASARDVLRSGEFWVLTASFFLAGMAAIGVLVQAIPFLLEHGRSAAFAAFAVGLVGISQIPGRLLFGPVAARVSSAAASALVFGQVATGIAIVAVAPSSPAVLAGFLLLGMGNGMATLLRPVLLAERYGSRDRRSRDRRDDRSARRRSNRGGRGCDRPGLPHDLLDARRARGVRRRHRYTDR
jgi:MFS family permease